MCLMLKVKLAEAAELGGELLKRFTTSIIQY